MGITISSKRHGCDMGYGGFGIFRNIVAGCVGEEFQIHYLELSSPSAMFSIGDARREYFETYDSMTREYVSKGFVTQEVANFLYQSDCGGKIDKKQAMQIFELIKDCDDSIIFGYVGRQDCAKMSDMKKIFSDKTKVEWH
jgi:hypothetical protein